MGTQEFYADVNLKGNQLKEVVVDVVTTLPETATAGRIVSMGGEFYVGNGTKWVKMADNAVVTALSKTVDGHTTKIEKLEAAVGTDESGNNLTTRVSNLETTVNDETTGLKKKVADNADSISTNATAITNLGARVTTVENEAKTNASNITTLQTDLDTAEKDIDNLETSVGTTSDTASATGSVYARIAQNVADIGTLNTTVGDSTSGLTKKVADLESGKVDKDGSKVLSTNDYTTAEKTKLSGIAEGAQVNVIEKVLFQGSGASSASALTITDKGVTIDLHEYALKSNLANAYIYKGSVEDTTNLPTSGQTAGDVYNIEKQFTYDSKVYPAGTNVAWNGMTGKWDPLGGTVDLSSYATKSYVDTEVKKKQDTLSETQLAAANSGITAVRVTTYDGYASSISTNATNIAAVKKTADAAVVANDAITKATKCKITYDTKGLVTKGEDLAASDIPDLSAKKITSDVLGIDRLPIMAVTKTVSLSTSSTTSVASGMATALVAQVLYNGKVIFVDTTISGGTVTLGTASKALENVSVNIIGLR